jgi:diguanylate cyclase
MLRQDESTKASEYLRQAVPLLSKLQLPPTPINYSTVYCYLTGASLALNEVIDNLISEKKPFTVAVMLELHEKYVNGSASLAQQDKIQKSLEKIMAEASDEIQHVNNGANVFDSSINQHADNLSSLEDPQAAALVLKQVLQDTRSMVSQNQEIQNRMQETNAEIMKVKAELEQVKAASEKDALTGLKNRGAFDTAIEHAVASTDTSETVLVMLDIDHFKRVNDNFGHLVGDRVIRYVSALLTQVIGKDNHIARYGGEEFAIIVTNKSADDVSKITDKVRIAMGNSKLQRKDSGETIGKITVSAGIAKLLPGDSVEAFIDRADKALYEAKETGRNKIVVSQ